MKTSKTRIRWFCLTSLGALIQLVLSVGSHAATFTVTTTADSGSGSLRQAITNANFNLGADTIAFNIPGTGPHTIQPLSALPTITDPVIVDGYTQSGASPNTMVEGDNTVLKIVLDGSLAGDDLAGGPPVYGLEIVCGSTTVRGLVVANFADSGIFLRNNGGNAIQGNIIGTDGSGSIAQGNGLRSPPLGSFSWGGDAAVKLVLSSDNLIGGTSPAARNLISGNLLGIRIDPGDRNRIQGNLIGTDASGTRAVPNLQAGIAIFGTQDGYESIGNVIGGGAPGAGNLISGNRKPDPVNWWDGGYGIWVQDRGGAVIQGNKIGTDVTGKLPLGNQHGAVVTEYDLAVGALGALVGGTGPGEGNLISGNEHTGLMLGGTARKVVQSNLIGTDVGGSQPLGNGDDGILLAFAADCLIGGTISEARNVISCNGNSGVNMVGDGADHNAVQGNFIGTDITGTRGLFGQPQGIMIQGRANNLIGGLPLGARNVISGNGVGVWISGSDNKVQGNFIGTDVSGRVALGNGAGVYLGIAAGTSIGGVEPGAGNLISGNNLPSGYAGGLYLNGAGVTGTRVQGNLIGTDITGTLPLANTVGMTIDNSSDNAIGGSEPATANRIAHSLYYGIWVTGDAAVRNSIRGNSIFDNGLSDPSSFSLLGLDLSSSGLGVTPNDVGDADTGPNNLQNFPTITSASTSPGNVQIQGMLNSTPNTTFTLDFYANHVAHASGYGEGETYLGAATVTTDPSGNASFNVTLPLPPAAGQIITATATDPAGNTSEFSQTLRSFPADACGYDLQVTVGYEFGGCSSSGQPGYCANPDAGFVIIKNNGPAPFVGELRLDGVSGFGSYGHQEIHDTTGVGYVLAPGASFRLEAGDESSNYGGWNKVCNGPDNGLLLSIIGKSAGLDINYRVFDKDIHSGVFRDIHASPSQETGTPLLSDSHILQGGDPSGGDTGDTFEVAQAHAIFHIQAACSDPCTLICPGNITVCDDKGQCGAVVTFVSPSLSGGCQGVTISCSPASGSFFPVGSTSVNCTATDGSGNVVTSCSFTVTVTETDPPPVACPKDITVGNDPGQCGAIVNYRNVQSQSDDFNDGNDDGWTRLSPGTVPAVFTFPNGGYRFQTTTPSGNANEPGRVESLREDVTYSDFYLSVDLVDWKEDTRQLFGLLARISTPGHYTTRGYAFYYDRGNARGSGVTPTSGFVVLSRVFNEGGSGVSSAGIHLDPAKDYRFVFIGKGPHLEGRIYELPNICTPVLTITGTDATYTSGYSGLVVYDNSGGLGVTDVTFDNYFASEVEPLSDCANCSPASGSFFPVGTTTVTCTEANGCGTIVHQCTFTVTVRDNTPPVITTCLPAVSVPFGGVPAAATTVTEFQSQGGAVSDNCGLAPAMTSSDSVAGLCPTIVTRTYTVKDTSGNPATCQQTITVNNLFAGDGIVWHQPLARNGASEDTDPSAGGTLKYRFKLGSTIPIQIHAQGCSADVTANANVIGKVVVFGDSNCDGVADGNALAIDYNGVGEAGGIMDKIDGHLKFNLDTKKLPQTTKCYLLQVTVTDTSTGESRSEMIPVQAK
ncbi:MAG: HYR domain-containing protein [Verrucomicrobia bacterium]|nr:HYR domain-containing protein [Verrucomicrobiota bacterium]